MKKRVFYEFKDVFHGRGKTINNKKQLYDEAIEIFPIIDKYGKPVSRKRRNLNRT